MSGGAIVELVWIEKQIEHWIRFGRIARTTIQSRSRSTVAFDPGAVFAFDFAWCVEGPSPQHTSLSNACIAEFV